MTLREYREQRGLTQTAFAQKLGISSNYLCEIEKGSECSLRLAVNIEDATDGAVKPRDLLAGRQKELARA